jgi:Fe-S-cluster-containing hydrogenase component 2
VGVVVDKKLCISCGGCVSVCPVMALELKDRYPTCDFNKCVNCETCVKFCPAGALKLKEKEHEDD